MTIMVENKSCTKFYMKIELNKKPQGFIFLDDLD